MFNQKFQDFCWVFHSRANIPTESLQLLARIERAELGSGSSIKDGIIIHDAMLPQQGLPSGTMFLRKDGMNDCVGLLELSEDCLPFSHRTAGRLAVVLGELGKRFST